MIYKYNINIINLTITVLLNKKICLLFFYWLFINFFMKYKKIYFQFMPRLGYQSAITHLVPKWAKCCRFEGGHVVRVSQNWLTRQNSPGAKPMKQIITQTTNFHAEEMKERQWRSLERLYGHVSLTGNTPGETVTLSL